MQREVARERRHERGAHRAFGEEVAHQVGNAEGDEVGVHLVARAEQRGEHLLAHEAEEAAGERGGAGETCGVRDAVGRLIV